MNADVLSALLCQLTAWVEYHVQVAASTSTGHGPAATVSTWTEIATPDRPPAPRVNTTGPGTITVVIEPAELSHGPLSAYFIVISTPANSTSHSRRRRSVAGPAEYITDPVWYIAALSGGVTVAQLSADDVPVARHFVVGDGLTYGPYENPPLSAESVYTVHYVVESSHDNVTKMNYSSTSRPVAALPSLSDRLSREMIVVVVLSAALLILLVLVILVVYWRCRQTTDRPSSSLRPPGSTMNASWLKYYTGLFACS